MRDAGIIHNSRYVKILGGMGILLLFLTADIWPIPEGNKYIKQFIK